jgi:hypothetical protein
MSQVLKILPEIFAQRRMQLQFNNWVNEQFKMAAGGVDLQQRPKPKPTEVGLVVRRDV